MSVARAIELSYGEMTTLSSGAIMSKQRKIDLRKQFGYCLTCPLVPVQTHLTQKSRLNPLWVSKKPLSVKGESYNGTCLKCQPELDPHCQGKRRHAVVRTRPSFRSTPSTSSVSTVSKPSSRRSGGRRAPDRSTSQESHESSTPRAPRRRASVSHVTVSSSDTLSGTHRQDVPAPPPSHASPASNHEGSPPQPLRRSSLSHVSVQSSEPSLPRSPVTDTIGRDMYEYQSSPQRALRRRSSLSHVSVQSSEPSLPRSPQTDTIGRDMYEYQSSPQRAPRRRSSLTHVSVPSNETTRAGRGLPDVPLTTDTFNYASSPQKPPRRRSSLTHVSVQSGEASLPRGSHGMSEVPVPANDTSQEYNYTSSPQRAPRRRSSLTHVSVPSIGAMACRPPPPRLPWSTTGDGTHESRPVRYRTVSPTARMQRRGGRHPRRAVEPVVASPKDAPRRLPQRLECYSSCSTVSELSLDMKCSDLVPVTSHEELWSEVSQTLAEVKSTHCGELVAECLLVTMKTHKEEGIQRLCLHEIIEGTLDASLDHHLFVAEMGDVLVSAAMEAFPETLTMQRIGSQALEVLAASDTNRTMLVGHGACHALKTSLERFSDDIELATSVLATLRILSTTPDRTNIPSLASVTVAVMTRHVSSPLIQRDGCAILSNMAVDSTHKTVTSVSPGEIQSIATAIRRHAHDENVVASGCFALKNFAYNETNLRTMSRNAHVVQALQCAEKFDSIYISSVQTLEKLHMAMALNESLEEYGSIESNVTAVEQSRSALLQCNSAA